MGHIGEGFAQLAGGGGECGVAGRGLRGLDFTSTGRHVRLMWKVFRNKIRPFVLDVMREVEAAVKKEGAWKYG
eukprot:evm.model.NODE_24648_length_37160_cov_56.512592.10